MVIELSKSPCPSMFTTTILRDHAESCWYRYYDAIGSVTAQEIDEVQSALIEVEARVEREQVYAAGFVTYEAAGAFDEKLCTHAQATLPLLCFTFFSRRERLDGLDAPDKGDEMRDSNLGEWQLDIDADDYRQKIQEIQYQIGAGDYYQVNYTARLKAEGVADLSTFTRIASAAPYAAFLQANEFNIVSASPELFFSRDGEKIQCRPMKGTIPRGNSSVSDINQAQWLQASAKNRAENLMITDMVRNDLGRIARAGSVAVPKIFHIEQYPTVWQMTSKVTARTNASIVDVFKALYPAASITGAPKRASMECINRLETSPREIYTGTIGYIAPNQKACFSVAIRTIWSDKNTNTSHYGAGGGIVWDSNVEDEYAELLAKTQVLYTRQQNVCLLETMRWSPAEGFFLLAEHLSRLASSARYFAIDCDIPAIEARLAELARELASTTQRVRLTLNQQGDIQLQATELQLNTAPQELMLAKLSVKTCDNFLYHKTTQRQVYEQAAAQVGAGYEALLCNEHGYVTESVIANVVYELDGEHFTPPVSDGLLPGTLRSHLLEEGKIQERSLHVRDIHRPTAWFLVNALRGWRTAQLVSQEANANAEVSR